jgi:membrane protein YdbS with pleckstrin-like domain
LTYTLWIDPRGWAPGAALAAALALLLLGVWFWVRPPKLYARLSYRLDPLGLSIESGRLWRRWTFVPRQRVQFVDLVSGPIDQRFGLADLVLHTAGSEAAEVRLPGLSREVAEALRAELLTGLEREPR